ncbi:MAG: hypothetical protein ACREQO_23475, partial [Candidatus Binatia bacterium]
RQIQGDKGNDDLQKVVIECAEKLGPEKGQESRLLQSRAVFSISHNSHSLLASVFPGNLAGHGSFLWRYPEDENYQQNTL